MLQVRKLVLAVAAATAFSSSFTHALGLGDLSVKSSLNQPLEAEISLLEVRELTSIEIKSQLASPEEFSKAGVDRQFFLTGLKFTPVVDASGRSVIRVTSSKPIKEPYLNFLVEVLWPNGRLLREYTLLLDPPLYKPQQVIYAPQPASTAPTRIQPQSQPQPIVRAAAPAQAPNAAKPTTSPLQGTEYRVQKNDTLWEVASRVGGAASVHQTMLAIQDLNPDAFLNGNINRLKSGQVLRLPSAEDINSRSRAEAIAQVSQQNDSWKTASAAPVLAERQLDATHRAQAGAAPAQIEKTDSLRLVADAPGKAAQAADQGTAAEVSALQDQLASNKERLDSTVLENEELQGRVDDLNSQLEKLQRLIELKDNQLAQLQNAVDTPLELAAVDTLDNVDEQVNAQSSDTSDTPSMAAAEQELDESDSMPAVGAEAEQADDLLAVEAEVETEPEVAAEPEVSAEAEQLDTKTKAEPVAPVVQAAAPQEAEDKSVIDKIKDDPLLLGGVGAGAILGLLLLLMGASRSRARKEAELYSDQLDEAMPVHEFDSVATEGVESDDPFAAATPVVEETEAVQSDAFAEDFVFDEPAAEPAFKEEASDPIAEADSYISFGRFSQAAAVLNTALEREPERIDLRLKLVEVLADLEDHAGFSNQINELTEIGGASSELAQIKARYPHMLGAEQVENVSAGAEFTSFADISLDDLTLDTPADTELTSTAAAELDAELDDLSALLAESESTEQAAVTDFDFDLELDLPESTTPAVEAGGLSDEVKTSVVKADEGLDEDADSLSLDFDTLDFDRDTSDLSEKASSLDELSLDDLTLDLADDGHRSETLDFELLEGFDSVTAEGDDVEDAATDFALQLDEIITEQDATSSSVTEEAPVATDFSLDELEFELDEQASAVTKELDSELQLDDLQDLDGIDDDDFGFLSGTDETATKLDLARAYIDMGDAEGARDILDEVAVEGDATQQEQARELMSQLG